MYIPPNVRTIDTKGSTIRKFFKGFEISVLVKKYPIAKKINDIERIWE